MCIRDRGKWGASKKRINFIISSNKYLHYTLLCPGAVVSWFCQIALDASCANSNVDQGGLNMLAYMCTQTHTCILMLSAHMLAPGALTESSCIIYIMVTRFQKAWMLIHVVGNENDQRCHS